MLKTSCKKEHGRPHPVHFSSAVSGFIFTSSSLQNNRDTRSGRIRSRLFPFGFTGNPLGNNLAAIVPISSFCSPVWARSSCDCSRFPSAHLFGINPRPFVFVPVSPLLTLFEYPKINRILHHSPVCCYVLFKRLRVLFNQKTPDSTREPGGFPFINGVILTSGFRLLCCRPYVLSQFLACMVLFCGRRCVNRIFSDPAVSCLFLLAKVFPP